MLFNETIFGPIKSRRLGTSLGVNLLPSDGKVCTFDCIYCECGFNSQGKGGKLPTREQVATLLESKLKQMREENSPLDVITFAGNGEPTVHPQFGEIIDDSIALRDRYYPTAKVSVLSNSTRIADESVFNALLKVDNNILKLDSAIDRTFRLMNAPNFSLSVNEVVDQLIRFNGKLIIQTMFLRGVVRGETVDNTTKEEIDSWIYALNKINPQQVMIYSLDRPTPEKELIKVSSEELRLIAQIAVEKGFNVSATI